VLHDIGWIEGQKGHHKTAMRRILDARELPLDDRERQVVAQIARYHRKSPPLERHKSFAVLGPPDQHRVRVLAGILRVADGLDRSHMNVVRRLRCECLPGQIVLRGEIAGPAHFEKWAAQSKGDLLESVFGRKLVIELVNG